MSSPDNCTDPFGDLGLDCATAGTMTAYIIAAILLLAAAAALLIVWFRRRHASPSSATAAPRVYYEKRLEYQRGDRILVRVGDDQQQLAEIVRDDGLRVTVRRYVRTGDYWTAPVRVHRDDVLGMAGTGHVA